MKKLWLICRRERIIEKVNSYHSGQKKKQKKTLFETPPSSSKCGSQSVTSDVEDDIWVTDDELTVAGGQANIFERGMLWDINFLLFCVNMYMAKRHYEEIKKVELIF